MSMTDILHWTSLVRSVMITTYRGNINHVGVHDALDNNYNSNATMHTRCDYRLGRALMLCLAALLYPLPVNAGEQDCKPTVATASSIQGLVQVRRNGSTLWQKIALHGHVCLGDSLRVGTNSRAALQLSNDTLLRLDQHSAITFVTDLSREQATLKQERGSTHFISRVKKPFKVLTPFVNAGVEGTEFSIGVTTQQTQITVFEGRVLAQNTQGKQILTSGQTALATAGQAPQLQLRVNPRDAVQWSLYYPALLTYLPSGLEPSPRLAPKQQQSLQRSLSAYRQGDSYTALTAISGLDGPGTSNAIYLYRAALYLAFGRVAEAEADLNRVANDGIMQADALALRAIIALTQNHKQRAQELAQQALSTNNDSLTAQLAMSYIAQARFDLSEAKQRIDRALAQAPDEPLLLLRAAELQLSVGQLDQALAIAEPLSRRQPHLARVHSVLGFAYLAQIKSGRAQLAFARAIELDPSDPMARLGLGLAIIRRGELSAGRRQIELATSLDPNNSLIRSYLGKAYYEERRGKLAATQLGMAKGLDPQDPTPWYYDAIRKQSENRPVEALRDLQQSMALNDNRAVYRSQLLLDQDQAARSASLARIYHDLGFDNSALAAGWKSVNGDPSNHSAHRLLADSYASLPRHKIARVSELLRAQLLQPLNLNPIQPQLAESGLGILDGAGPSELAFNEFNPLFVRDGVSAQFNGIAAGDRTRGNDFVFSGLHGRYSYSLGQFHYQTQGWKDNDEDKAEREQDIYNLYAQVALSHKTSIQFEQRYLKQEEQSEIIPYLSVDPDLRFSSEIDASRLGLHHAFSPRSDLLISVLYRDNDGHFTFVPGSFNEETSEGGYLSEIQYLYNSSRFSLIAGAGYYGDKFEKLEYIPLVFSDSFDSTSRHKNAYAYGIWRPSNKLDLTLGVSVDDWVSATDIEHDQVNPKLGVSYSPTASTTLRLAGTRVLKRNLVASQTIEPTQVAGFNQFFDDPLNGTDARRYGIALDQSLGQNLYAGIEYSIRDLIFPPYNLDDYDRRENLNRFYLYWAVNHYMTLSTEYHYERVWRNEDSSFGVDPNPNIDTRRGSLGTRLFLPSGLSAEIQATRVSQYAVGSFLGVVQDRFWSVDAAFSYRLPRRHGRLAVGVKNLNDEEFSYFDYSDNPLFYPKRLLYTQLTLDF